jgi:hypothetical protein
MQKQNLTVGAIYNLKYWKTMTVPVRVLKIGMYKAEIQYLDPKTLEVKAVPNPPVYGAFSEAVPFARIKNEYHEAN